MRNKDAKTENMFKPDSSERSDFGVGYYKKENGEIVDDQGRLYAVDEDGNLCDQSGEIIKEKPSEGLKMARKQHPDWTDEQLSPLAAVHNNEIKMREEVGESEYLAQARRMLPGDASDLEVITHAYRLKTKAEKEGMKKRK